MTGDPTLPERLLAGYRPDERMAAVLDYATKVTRDSHGIGPAEIDALRKVGLTEAEIFDAAETAAMFNFTNRLTSALGMVPNAEFEKLGR